MLKDFVPADKGTQQKSETGSKERQNRGREKQREWERYTEEEGAREGLGGISVLNISFHQAGNNADLENAGQWWVVIIVNWASLSLIDKHFFFKSFTFRTIGVQVLSLWKCLDTIWIKQMASQLPNFCWIHFKVDANEPMRFQHIRQQLQRAGIRGGAKSKLFHYSAPKERRHTTSFTVSPDVHTAKLRLNF